MIQNELPFRPLPTGVRRDRPDTRPRVSAFAVAWGDAATPARCRLAAHAAIALADGLALHAVTTTGWLRSRQLTATVDLVLEALLGS